jgi:putative heme-binding domain-containing protein
MPPYQEEAMRGLTALVLTLACFGQTGDERSPRMTPEDVAAGAKTFRSHCAECHGLKAEGGRGPSLATGEFYHGSSDAELLKNISEGIPGTEMPALFYSEDRVWQVVAYIRSLNKASGSLVSGNPVSGQAVFRSAGCGDCHRIQGNGGRMGPDLTSIGKIRSPEHLRQAIVDPGADVRQRYWAVELTTADGKSISGFLMNQDTYTVQFIDTAGQLHSYPKPELKSFKTEKVSKMPSYKDRFSKQELDDLVAFLSSLRPGKRGEK